MKKIHLFIILLIAMVLLSGCPREYIPPPAGHPPLWEELCFLEAKSYSCNSFNIGNRIRDEGGVEAFKITYKSEGLKINGVLVKPKNIEGKAPLIIFNHGGVNGINLAHGEWIEMLAKEGYVVLASSYRGETDKLGTSEGTVEVAKGETTDVLNLMECGKDLDYVNSSKIGMIGTSHGGGITVQAIELSEDITAAISFYGLTNLFNHYERYESGVMQGDGARLEAFEKFEKMSDSERNQELKNRNAIDCVSMVNSPLLIIHGKADINIPVEEGYELRDEMEKYGKTYDFVAYDGVAHGFNYQDTRQAEDSWKKTKEWFDKYLN